MKIKTKLRSNLRVMLLLVTVLCLPTTAKAIYFDVDGIHYVSNGDNSVYVSSVRKSGDIVIPSTVTYEDKTYTVTAIFGIGSNITGISIPSTVTSIGIYTQEYGQHQTNIFSDSDDLTHITVARGNPIYDSRDNCNAIIETASNTLLAGCKSTVITNTVTAIGEYAFASCSGLTNVELGNSVTTIGENAFVNCSSLTNVEFGNSLTTIGRQAFWGCCGLTSITLPNTLISISDGTFAECSSLSEVRLPDSLTTIGSGAFYGCSELTSLDIPSTVTEIGSCAFRDSKIYEDQHGIVYAGNWVVDYKNDVPGDCVIKDGTVGIASYTFYYDSYDSEIEPPFTNLVIPNSVLYIGAEAFYYDRDYNEYTDLFNVSPIKTIVIGESVKTIGSLAFYTGSQSRYNDYGTLIDGDVDLQSITCLAIIPPKASDTFASHIFDNPIDEWYETDYVIYHRVPLYVPMESVDAYKNDEEWGRFNTIIGIDVNDHLDVNGDGEVTIGDVSSIINVIINSTYTSDLIIYDVNGDSEVTVADINTIIDAILGN